MTNVFAVIGEHRHEPTRLLLLGDDGQYYAYGTTRGEPTQVIPSDEWTIDAGAGSSSGTASLRLPGQTQSARRVRGS